MFSKRAVAINDKPINFLVDDVVREILSLITSPNDIASIDSTSRGFYSLNNSNLVWRQRFQRCYPDLYQKIISANYRELLGKKLHEENWHERFVYTWLHTCDGMPRHLVKDYWSIRRGDVAGIIKLIEADNWKERVFVKDRQGLCIWDSLCMMQNKEQQQAIKDLLYPKLGSADEKEQDHRLWLWQNMSQNRFVHHNEFHLKPFEITFVPEEIVLATYCNQLQIVDDWIKQYNASSPDHSSAWGIYNPLCTAAIYAGSEESFFLLFTAYATICENHPHYSVFSCLPSPHDSNYFLIPAMQAFYNKIFNRLANDPRFSQDKHLLCQAAVILNQVNYITKRSRGSIIRGADALTLGLWTKEMLAAYQKKKVFSKIANQRDIPGKIVKIAKTAIHFNNLELLQLAYSALESNENLKELAIFAVQEGDIDCLNYLLSRFDHPEHDLLTDALGYAASFFHLLSLNYELHGGIQNVSAYRNIDAPSPRVISWVLGLNDMEINYTLTQCYLCQLDTQLRDDNNYDIKFTLIANQLNRLLATNIDVHKREKVTGRYQNGYVRSWDGIVSYYYEKERSLLDLIEKLPQRFSARLSYLGKRDDHLRR